MGGTNCSLDRHWQIYKRGIKEVNFTNVYVYIYFSLTVSVTSGQANYFKIFLEDISPFYGATCTVPKYRAAVDYTPRLRAPMELTEVYVQ